MSDFWNEHEFRTAWEEESGSPIMIIMHISSHRYHHAASEANHLTLPLGLLSQSTSKLIQASHVVLENLLQSQTHPGDRSGYPGRC